jgi:quercetin dioxygenase-like cupin family protein
MVEFAPGDRVPQHYHKVTKEVFFALDRAVFEINGERVILEPDDVLICEPGDVHGNPVIESAFRILVIKVGYEAEDTVWMQ